MANPSQITTAIEGYAGTYSKELIGQLLNALDIAKDIYVMRNVKAPVNLTKLTITAGIRPLNTKVDTVDSAGRTWSGRQITVKPGMKIFEVIPEELRKTWMSEMLDPNAEDVPFAQWVWDQEFAKIAEEINESVYLASYHADAAAYDAGAIYTGGTSFINFEENIYKCVTTTTAGQSPTTHPAKWLNVNAASITTGLGTIIAAEIVSGGITAGQVIATNAISSTNAVAELRKVYLGAPVKMRKKKAIMYISPDVYENYKADYDTRYGKGNGIADGTEDAEVIYLKGTSKKVLLKEATWMGASGRVIYTLEKNLVMATDQEDALNSIGKMIPTLHGLKAIMKFLLGFQIQDLEVLYVNDKA